MSVDLSVCIPTYGRAQLLRASLVEVLAQRSALSEAARARLQVVVVDNVSPDATPLVIRSLLEQDPAAFEYVRLEQSVGPANVLLCSRNAVGEFVLLLSDDDLLRPGALASLLDIVKTPDLDAASLNITSFVDDPSAQSGEVFARHGFTSWCSAVELLHSIGTQITFMSALVYRRRLVADVAATAAQDTYLPHVHAFLEVLRKGRTFLLLGEPMIAYRQDAAGPYDYVEVFLRRYPALLRDSGLPLDDMLGLQRAHLRRHVRPMLVHMKQRGSFGDAHLDWTAARRALVQQYWRLDPFGALTALLVTVMPRSAVSAVAWTRGHARRRGWLKQP